MKKAILLFIISIITATNFSCKKFLNINPPNSLSGNNFWQTQEDVDAYVNGMYQQLRQSVSRPDLTANFFQGNFPFFMFSGDLRGAPIRKTTNVDNRFYITQLAENNLVGISGTRWSNNFWNVHRFGQWDKFYDVIASANIALKEIDKVTDPKLSDAGRKAFKAEAVFLRCISYFLMVRQWGDVPYYTEAYFTGQLERMPMVDVLKNCVADLAAVYGDLPWTYDNPVLIGVRAMKGSAIALLMHMNMWLAAFDEAASRTYYEQTTTLGTKLRSENGGVYELLSLDLTGEIFKGRSSEGLFEVPQNANYGESFAASVFFDHVKFTEGNRNLPYIAYEPEFMYEIFPEGVEDKRKTAWYKVPEMYDGGTGFRMTKFYVSTDVNAIDNGAFDASQTVFRYSDAMLLEAEAWAKIDNNAKALEVANLVRARAQAEPLSSSGIDLLNDIFYERCRELMGEGHYWYDVVRTKRIIDPNYNFGYHCTIEQFKNGCWTWFIDNEVLKNSPKMRLNDYWVR